MNRKKVENGTRPKPTQSKDAAMGLGLGSLSLAASFLAALELLGRPYYVEWLAVAFMGFYLLVAWLLYLRDDAFMKRRGRDTPPPNVLSGRSRRVLLAASVFLALASLVLYFGFGIGAKY
jgi:hypothetical protein